MTAPLDNGEANGATGSVCDLLGSAMFCHKFAKAICSLTDCSSRSSASDNGIAPGLTLADHGGRQALKSANGFKARGHAPRKTNGVFLGRLFFPAAQRQKSRKFLDWLTANLPEQIERFRLAADSHDSPPVARAKELARQCYREIEQPLTTPRVAKKVGLSLSYFCALFKKQVGMTFMEYLLRVRIEEAKRQLRNHSLRISEIAYAVGFQSIPYFNRAFRNSTGKSPTQFRATALAFR